MNLETMVKEELWDAVRSSYETSDYRGAIIDAMFYLFDVIREKSGLETDGVALVGEALGGNSPKLRINRLETTSEKDEQKGMEQIIRGLYTGIRNPRSHRKVADTEKNAAAIIMFVDYLLGVVGQSKTPFTKGEFVKKVFDPGFVEKEQYGELLVKEIPKRHRRDIMLEVFRNRENGDVKKLGYFTRALLAKLAKTEKDELYGMVSDELAIADNERSISLILNLFPARMLKHCSEATRLRIENKMIESVAVGTYDAKMRRLVAGGLGTFVRQRAKDFTMKDELMEVITAKMKRGVKGEQAYVYQYIWRALPQLASSPPWSLAMFIRAELKGGNVDLQDNLLLFVDSADLEWLRPFEKEMKEFVPREEGIESDDSDLPF